MKRIVLFSTMFLSLLVFMDTSFAVEVTLLGPERYLRTKGKPNIYTNTFPGIPGKAKLVIANGDESGKHRISSAKVMINGQKVTGPKDFNQKVNRVEIPINILEDNLLTVKLRSKPGAYLTVTVVQEVETDSEGPIFETASTVDVTLLGPERYLRTRGRPNIYTNTFPGIPGKAKLVIANGDEGGKHRISSAKVMINGQKVAGPKDFNQKVNRVEIPINVLEDNLLTVKLRSKPEAYLTVTVVQEVEADAAAVIGPDGGIVEVADPENPIFGTAVEIPPGALTKPLVIFFSGLLEPTEGKEVILTLEPAGTNFLVPVTVILPIDVNGLGANERLAAIRFSEPFDYVPQQVFIIDDTAQVELDHFSRLYLFRVNHLYLVLDIPPEFLTKGDILYTFQPYSTSFGWFPGHTGMFIGEGANGINTIVESTPFSDGCTGSCPSPGHCFGVRISDWDTFFDDGHHLYMGARRPDNISSEIRNGAADFALDNLDSYWECVGPKPSDGAFSSVGLVEAAYEHVGLSIVEFPEDSILLPIQQFNKTFPADEITAQAGKGVSIPVRGVIDTDPEASGRYLDDPDLYDITASNLPIGATFVDNTFRWTPPFEEIGHTFTITFEVESKDKSISVSQ